MAVARVVPRFQVVIDVFAVTARLFVTEPVINTEALRSQFIPRSSLSYGTIGISGMYAEFDISAWAGGGCEPAGERDVTATAQDLSGVNLRHAVRNRQGKVLRWWDRSSVLLAHLSQLFLSHFPLGATEVNPRCMPWPWLLESPARRKARCPAWEYRSGLRRYGSHET